MRGASGGSLGRVSSGALPHASCVDNKMLACPALVGSWTLDRNHQLSSPPSHILTNTNMYTQKFFSRLKKEVKTRLGRQRSEVAGRDQLSSPPSHIVTNTMSIRKSFSRLKKKVKTLVEETELLGELEALEVCDCQSLVSLCLNSYSVRWRYLRRIHSSLSIPAQV